MFYGIDLADEDSICSVFDTVRQEHGDPDILVNCAGISRPMRFRNITSDLWEKMLKINLTSQYLCIREVIEKMAENGVATNVHYKPLPMMTAYGKDCTDYPNSYDYYHNLITLPLHTLLSDEDVAYICEALRNAVK